MLDELADVIGQDLPVMGFSLRSAEEKIMLLSPFDNCRNRDFLPMLLPENIPDIAVVIGVDGDIRVIDQAFLPAELMEDVFFDRWTDRSGLLFSLIDDRKLRGVVTIVLQESKEPASPYLEDVEQIGHLDLFVDVTLEQGSDLLVTERPVKLFGHN